MVEKFYLIIVYLSLGESFDPDKFAHYVKELKPTYYIVPDVLEDGYQTIQKFIDFSIKSFMITYQVYKLV